LGFELCRKAVLLVAWVEKMKKSILGDKEFNKLASSGLKTHV